MGIAKRRHWVLLANAYDKSQLRSYIAGEIAHATDLAWSPAYRHVELILNGDYVGVYQLTEQVRIAGARVDIEEMSPDDNERQPSPVAIYWKLTLGWKKTTNRDSVPVRTCLS